MQTQLLRASVRRASPTSASFPPTSMPPCGRPPTMPSRCSIKPDGTARRRSRRRWEEPSTGVFLFPMSCLEPKEVVEEPRFSSHIHGLQRQRDGYSGHIGFSRARLRTVSPPAPVVVDTDCLKLELHRPHDQPHVLDYRRCFHRHHLVHGLLRIPLPSPAGKTGGVRSGEQKA